MSSRFAIHGTQPTPASMKPQRISGQRMGTPVSSRLTRFAIIESGCASACCASDVSKQSSWNGKTGKTASTEWIATGSPVSVAAFQMGSYC